MTRLGNTQVIPQVDFTDRTQRSEFRWKLRNTLRSFSSNKRLRSCGTPVGSAVSIQKLNTGHGAVGNLESCSSVWSCPVCSAKISSHRQEEISNLVRKANQEKKVISMMTLTERHHKGQKLSELWKGLSLAWNYVTNSKRYKHVSETLGIMGTIRAVECTHGANGWHVHSHILIISDKPLTTPVEFYPYRKPAETLDYRTLVASRWGAKLAKLGIDFDDRVGIDLRTAKHGTEHILATYVGKVFGDISAEMTLGQFKQARSKENRTPFQILHDIQRFGDMEDVKLWHTWEKTSKGKRQLVWSRALRNWFTEESELTDEEIINQQTARETLFYLTRKDWLYLLNSNLGAHLLVKIQFENITEVEQFLTSLGVPIHITVNTIESERKNE